MARSVPRWSNADAFAPDDDDTPPPEIAAALPSSGGNSGPVADLSTLLNTAVDAVGGAQRSGQARMAEAVEHAIDTGEHLAVQAGTGTGKSLAYLVPALRHAVRHGKTVVVSTSTIALQRQLIDRDLPRLAEALTGVLGRRPTSAILKGRRNYLCLNRIHGNAPADPEEGLFDPFAASSMERQINRLQEWAQQTETGDRDELVPGVSDRAWRQVSVTAKECLGAHRCPMGDECFAELARAATAQVDIVVTNHSLLAIDALDDRSILPEADVVVVDEAHDLVDRVTSAATGELTAPLVTNAARRCGRVLDERIADALAETADGVETLLGDAPAGRVDELPEQLAGLLRSVRDAASSCVTALKPARGEDVTSDSALSARAISSASTGHSGTSVSHSIKSGFGPDLSSV